MSLSYRTDRDYVGLVLAFSPVHLLPLDILRLWGGLYPMQINEPASVVWGLVGIQNVTEKFCFSCVSVEEQTLGEKLGSRGGWR